MQRILRKFLEELGIEIIATLVVLFMAALLAYFYPGLTSDVLLYNIPLWGTMMLILLFFASMFIFFDVKPKGRTGLLIAPLGTRTRAAPHVVVSRHEVDMFGVKWEVLYGIDVADMEPYGVARGPFCPKCMYEMSTEERGFFAKRLYWKCIPCNRFYNCPERSSGDAARAVEKYVESEERKARMPPHYTAKP